MKIVIELVSELNCTATKGDIQKNIDGLKRLLKNSNPADAVALIDTLSILTGIQKQLPERRWESWA